MGRALMHRGEIDVAERGIHVGTTEIGGIEGTKIVGILATMNMVVVIDSNDFLSNIIKGV
jgi:hypothetical protein